MLKRVLATDAALELIQRLTREHGPLLFRQSGGCCNDSVPVCYRSDELEIDAEAVLIGEIGGCPYYLSRLECCYWRESQLVIDAVAARGAIFSLEGAVGMRFVARSRPLSATEQALLDAQSS